MTTDDLTPTVPTDSPTIPAGMTKEQAEAIRAAISQMASSGQQTVSGAEAPLPPGVTLDAQAQQAAGRPAVLTGKDVDWSDYDIAFELQHHYRNASFIETAQGPKWVVPITEFFSNELDLRGYDKKTQKGEPMNLGKNLTEFLSRGEGWQIAALLPTTNGRVGVLFERKSPMILPDPMLLEKPEEVPVLPDEAVVRLGKKGDDWAESEGLTEETPSATVVQAQPLPGSIERAALDLNGRAEVDPAATGPGEYDFLSEAAELAAGAPEGGIDPNSITPRQDG